MKTAVSKLAANRMEKGENARVRKTLENIRQAFQLLILQKDYGEIRVAELCRMARIGRKTFYTHFSSLDDLMGKSLARMAEEYISRIKDLGVPEDLREITRQFYLYSEEQGLFYEKLICSGSYRSMAIQLLMRFVEGAWQHSAFYNSLSPIYRHILLCFIYDAGSAIYREWVIGSRKAPLEEIADISAKMLADGINGILCQTRK